MDDIDPKNKINDQTSMLLRETAKGLVEGLFGIAASDRKDLILSLGHIFQRMRSGTFLNALLQEWERLREKGRIKEDYVRSEQHQECLQEMLDFLDRDSPDCIRFRMLKAILLGAATETQSYRDSVLPQQYMSICRTISSGEALVLQATFAVAERGDAPPSKSASDWLQIIGKESGLVSHELVSIHEQKLIAKNLLIRRIHGDSSGVALGKHYRLTTLGMEICRFIKAYEEQNTG
jgi:hypothetical protein